MLKISLENFIIANADLERSQYTILNALKEYKYNLKNYKLYPTLEYLSELMEELENVLLRKACIKECSPVRSIKFELPEDAEIINTTDFINAEMNKIWDLIEWGYDIISPIYEEALIIHDFIKQNVELMTIEESFNYEKTGCLLVPDNSSEELNFYKFSKFSKPYDVEPSHSIEANLVESIEFDDIMDDDLNNIGDKIVDGFPELGNSPVYALKTDLDLPFEESILPIAKKLLADELTA